MIYDKSYNGLSNWVISETEFSKRYLGKCEVIMAQGNGYMGVRAATEESYTGEVRNTFINGTFNKFAPNEVTELPNVADLTQMKIEVNGVQFDLTSGIIKNYSRDLNLMTGELTRSIEWISPMNDEIEIEFKRIVSLHNLHILAQRVEIKCNNRDLLIKIQSGINGQMTNSGVQHFYEGEKRLFENEYMQMIQTTSESNIDFVLNTIHSFKIENEIFCPKSIIMMDRRKIYFDYEINLPMGNKLTIEKISNVYSSRDAEYEGIQLNELRDISVKSLKLESKKGYKRLLEETTAAWKEQVWERCPILIESVNSFDQLAIRFAQYHLRIMTPFHDNRMSIAAKGLTGEGYKGHVFWDTEIFILPYYIYTNPMVASSLLQYRYNSLSGARKKAKENGYDGAMYPWESGWLDDGEVTPVWGAADIVTGKATKIWSGFIEQHITSDVAYAVWQYYQITKDEEFMDLYGYEMIMDTAKFWASRLEWDENHNKYHINNVIGPDEYKEHVNNNAFTNYMAHWNIRIAIQYYKLLKELKPNLYDKIEKKLQLKKAYTQWMDVVDKIYLPKPNENLIIPQDDTYLQKKIIDLKKYKNQEAVGTIFKDYNLKQVNEIQVSKQADIMILFYLMEDLFSKEIKIANWNYYEPKTLHDSSLSLSTHCALAVDMGDLDLAYDLFVKAANIDLGPNMKSSDHGIHAASLGGIWQCVVNGFGGVRMTEGGIRIEPKLPSTWKKLEFPIYINGEKLFITIEENSVTIIKLSDGLKEIKILHKNKDYYLREQIKIEL